VIGQTNSQSQEMSYSYFFPMMGGPERSVIASVSVPGFLDWAWPQSRGERKIAGVNLARAIPAVRQIVG
jgi:hypothetical protein